VLVVALVRIPLGVLAGLLAGTLTLAGIVLPLALLLFTLLLFTLLLLALLLRRALVLIVVLLVHSFPPRSQAAATMAVATGKTPLGAPGLQVLTL
jgi:hypothetical protein